MSGDGTESSDKGYEGAFPCLSFTTGFVFANYGCQIDNQKTEFYHPAIEDTKLAYVEEIPDSLEISIEYDSIVAHDDKLETLMRECGTEGEASTGQTLTDLIAGEEPITQRVAAACESHHDVADQQMAKLVTTLQESPASELLTEPAFYQNEDVFYFASAALFAASLVGFANLAGEDRGASKFFQGK